MLPPNLCCVVLTLNVIVPSLVFVGIKAVSAFLRPRGLLGLIPAGQSTRTVPG